jgi:hypothetical protein
MSEPQTLASFVAWGIRAFPAAKVALVIADHGGGWTGAAIDEVTAAQGGPMLLDLPSIAQGVSAGLHAAGRDKLDLIGFDACLMAEWDVARTVAPLADRMVASAESEPNDGWDWTFLADARGTDTADELAGRIITAYGEFYSRSRDGQDATMALLDLTALAGLDTAMGYLSASAVVGGTDDELVALARARAAAWEYGRSPDPTSDAREVDLGSWAAALATQGGSLGQAAAGVQTALASVVRAHWAGPGTDGATGLSVYLPQSAGATDKGYPEVASGSLWWQFLSDFHGRIADLVVPDPFPDDDAIAVDAPGDGGFTVIAAFDPSVRGLVVGGGVRLGALLEGGAVAYLRSASVTVSGDRAGGSDEFAFFQATDGAHTVPVYLDQESSTGIPYWYRSPAGDLTPVVVRLADGGDGSFRAVAATAVLPGSAAPTRVVLDPAGTLLPRFIERALDGTTAWTGDGDQAGLSADLATHVYCFGDIPPGTAVGVQIALRMADGTERTIDTRVTVG